MRLITRTRVNGWKSENPKQASALERWTVLVEQSNWSNLAQLKQTFQQADAVKLPSGNQVIVFNLNSFRLVAAVHFNTGIVFAREFMSHAEYEEGKWKSRS